MKRCAQCQAAYADGLLFCSLDGTPLHDEPGADPLLGHVIEDRYRLDARIGSGGFAAVYRAAHMRFPRDVAVKILHTARGADPGTVQRFQQEVSAAARIAHPNVVEMLDYGHDPRIGPFIVMPLLRGSPLHDVARRRPLSMSEIHAVVVQTLAALGAAHKVGVVHRDFKPENVLLASDPTAATGWRVKLLDFGVAKVKFSTVRSTDPEQRQKVLGTPAFMAPEQIIGEPVDGRTDIYSLGVVLYGLLCGELPFFGDDASEVMRQHVQDAPRPPSSQGHGQWIPPELDQFVLSLLAKDPMARPATTELVLQKWLVAQVAGNEAWAAHHLGAAPGAPRPPTDAVTEQVAAPYLGDGRSTFGGIATPAPPAPLVLVVDDDEAMRYLLRAVLQTAGWACETTDSAGGALEAVLGERTPDGVVIDMLMPGLHGLELLALLRTSGYAGPVVFCSALSSDQVRSEALSHGAGFINKATELQSLSAELIRVGAPKPG